MFQCFHCGTNSVVWQNDFTFDDVGYDGNGIVQFLTYMHCGAEIEYRIAFDEPEDAVDVEKGD